MKTFHLPPSTDGLYAVDETLWRVVEAVHADEGEQNTIVRRWVRRLEGQRKLAVPGWVMHQQQFFSQMPSRPVPYSGRNNEETLSNQRIAETVTWVDETGSPITDLKLVPGLIARARDWSVDKVTKLPAQNGVVVFEAEDEQLTDLYRKQVNLFDDLARIVRESVRNGGLRIVEGSVTVLPSRADHPSILKTSKVRAEHLIRLLVINPFIEATMNFVVPTPLGTDPTGEKEMSGPSPSNAFEAYAIEEGSVSDPPAISSSLIPSATGVVHRQALIGREDVLNPVIDLAIAHAGGLQSYQAVWLAFKALASLDSPAKPLIGLTDGEVRYEGSDEKIKFFSQKNLRDRLGRRRTKGALIRDSAR